jgi:hypothetical protein
MNSTAISQFRNIIFWFSLPTRELCVYSARTCANLCEPVRTTNKAVLGVYTRLHSVYVNVYVNVYIHYFIFKSISYHYVAYFKMFYKSYKTHKKYKRLHKCKRRALE